MNLVEMRMQMTDDFGLAQNDLQPTEDEYTLALNRGIQAFARDTKCLYREFTVSTATGVVTLPADMIVPRVITCAGSIIPGRPLEYISQKQLSRWPNSQWGYPRYWSEAVGTISIWPNPTFTTTQVIGLTCVGTTATATTATPHGLNVGGSFNISGATVTGYNIANGVVLTITSTTFTYTVATGSLSSDTSGTAREVNVVVTTVAGYCTPVPASLGIVGSFPLMELDTDCPPLPFFYHNAPLYWAEADLLNGRLKRLPGAANDAATAVARYKQTVAEFNADSSVSQKRR